MLEGFLNEQTEQRNESCQNIEIYLTKHFN